MFLMPGDRVGNPIPGRIGPNHLANRPLRAPEGDDLMVFTTTTPRVEATPGGLQVTMPGPGAADAQTILARPTPIANDWTFTALIWQNLLFRNYMAVGMCAMDTAGKVHTLSTGAGGSNIAQLRVSKWNSISSYNSDNSTVNLFQHYNLQWYRLRNDGVNLTMSVAPVLSGRQSSFVQLMSVAYNNWLGQIAYAGVNFTINQQSAPTGATAPESINILDYEFIAGAP